MSMLEYDRGDLLRYITGGGNRARVYLIESRSVGGRHGHLGCEVIPMSEFWDGHGRYVLYRGHMLFGNKGFTLPQTCGWLNVIEQDMDA